MMSEWKEYRLGDFAEINMGQSPKSEFYNTQNIGLPFLQGNRTFGIKYPHFDIYCSEPKKIAKKGDVLFSVRAPVGDINVANREICIGRGLAALRAKNNNNEYLYYLLHYLKNVIINNESGSVFGAVNKNILENIKFLLPPLPEQRAIAEVLSSLDDKIDLLHRQNKTLEQMAETLFRQWFVEEAKEDWEIDKLGNYVTVVDNRGKTPPNKKEKTPFPLIEVNALGKENRLIDYSVIRKYVDKDIFNTWFRNKPKKYDTLLSTVGSIGAISMYLLEIGNVAQNVIGLSPKNISPFYLYQLLKYRTNEILLLDIGGVQPSIKVPHLLSLEIPIPPVNLQNKFDNKVIDITYKMEVNYNHIRTLEKMRNTLLPKLMNGEVRVKYIK